VQFADAIRKAKKFAGYSEEEGFYTVETTGIEILSKWPLFHELFIVVANWTSFILILGENKTGQTKGLEVLLFNAGVEGLL
jgi:hypothetical protein